MNKELKSVTEAQQNNMKQNIKLSSRPSSNIIVSKIAITNLVLEAEKRVAKCIKDDIDFGYDLGMIINKIKTGSYVGSSLETFKTFKKHFC